MYRVLAQGIARNAGLFLSLAAVSLPAAAASSFLGQYLGAETKFWIIAAVLLAVLALLLTWPLRRMSKSHRHPRSRTVAPAQPWQGDARQGEHRPHDDGIVRRTGTARGR